MKEEDGTIKGVSPHLLRSSFILRYQALPYFPNTQARDSSCTKQNRPVDQRVGRARDSHGLALVDRQLAGDEHISGENGEERASDRVSPELLVVAHVDSLVMRTLLKAFRQAGHNIHLPTTGAR